MWNTVNVPVSRENSILAVDNLLDQISEKPLLTVELSVKFRNIFLVYRDCATQVSDEMLNSLLPSLDGPLLVGYDKHDLPVYEPDAVIQLAELLGAAPGHIAISLMAVRYANFIAEQATNMTKDNPENE